ncbi:uncharacterized protein DUF1854 [Sphaerotilus hippei]|uniref:Uncharacterized protein DUF1854 n=1 Tax=Sphaerotilus hippei TaxID=744406 RepID=A0A318H6P9_9BURK|nr:DUF1854 domain-containing protein [Sphaerotilus hippei]PXW99555.1 uncharacterized protein DUF1854 [Sphaerotilus hippei]
MSGSEPFQVERDAHGRLVLIDAQGVRHEGVVPVRAFPLQAPGEGVSLVGADGRECLWVPRLDRLPEPQRTLLDAECARREFMPRVSRLRSVSTFSTPSTWEVDTDRGATSFVLKGEEDIRRLPEGRLLITDSHGIQYEVPDRQALDRPSRRLLERFL